MIIVWGIKILDFLLYGLGLLERIGFIIVFFFDIGFIF